MLVEFFNVNVILASFVSLTVTFIAIQSLAKKVLLFSVGDTNIISGLMESMVMTLVDVELA